MSDQAPDPYADFPFRGTEAQGLILAGSLPLENARELCDGRFTPVVCDHDAGRAHAHITTLYMRDLKIRGLPLLRFHYPETVWNLLVRVEDRITDLSIQAHTNLMMRVPLAVFDKYNTAVCRIGLSREGAAGRLSMVRGENQILRAEFETMGPAPKDAPMIRHLLTRRRAGEYYRIPWGNTQPRELLAARCRITDRSLINHVFGEEWELTSAYYFTDRPHYCAPSTLYQSESTVSP